MRTLSQDLGYAIRGLLRRPGFTIIVVATIALGVGANAAIFSVVNGILLRPLPYPRADRVVTFGHEPPHWLASEPDFFDYHRELRSFEALAAYTQSDVTLTSGDNPERLRMVRASEDFFPALGVKPLLGRAFAIRSVLGIASLAGVLATVPFPDVTPDLTLTAVFGGFFLGAGIGLAVRGGAVLDGTEIAALVISRRADVLRVGDVILGFNVVLFLAAMSALGVEPALYSILTYLAAAKTLDFVLHGIDEYTAITIVSPSTALIRERITADLGRGVTVYKGYGGMSRAEQDILYCVVTRLEIGKVKAIVKEIDRSAFFVFHPLSGAEGGTFGVKRFHAGHAS